MFTLERLRHLMDVLPGFAMAVVIAVAASYIGHLTPVVGAPIVAILLGILFNLLLGRIPNAEIGVSFTAKRILQFAIILLGANLNLAVVWKTGMQSFWVMIGSLVIALIGGTIIGRLLHLPRNLTRLITVGTSICGASAISAISPLVDAEEGDIAYSISTIFTFNVIAVFLFPLIGHIFHFSSIKFGTWAGTAINDTSSVVAAGYSFSHAAGQYATVVKLTRSLAIIPISLWFAIHSIFHKKTSRSNNVKIKFPLFIVGFVMMSALDTFHVFGQTGGPIISAVGQFFISVALAAIGLNTNLRALLKTGYRPLLMGLCTWALVAISSLILQRISA